MTANPAPRPPDPATRALLAAIAEAGIPPMHTLTPAEARANMLAGRVNDIDPPALARVDDLEIPGPAGALRGRCYHPRPAPAGGLPVLLYFHGGGYVIGDLDTHDNICRQLALAGDAAVLAIDYRLAPEHRYPAAVDDALAAYEWVLAHAADVGGDRARLAVGGDSAGGTLAAVVAQRARDDGVALAAQILLYPVTDLAEPWPSHAEHAEMYPIPTPTLDWFWRHYLGDAGFEDAALRRDPRVSPLRAARLDGLAPAFVLTAGLDPLRDEAVAYSDRLAAAGVETAHHQILGTVHGFLRLGRLVPAAGDAIAAAGGFLRRRIAAA